MPQASPTALAASFPAHTNNPLSPLFLYYDLLHHPLPTVSVLPEGAFLPAPYSALLQHGLNMTPVLQSAFGQSIGLTVLKQVHDDSALVYHRWVQLIVDDRVVEFGSICIHLSALPRSLHHQLLEGMIPFGSLLLQSNIPMVNHPQSYFTIVADNVVHAALNESAESDDASLALLYYGRCNRITSPSGVLIAEVVEILPHLL